MKTPIEMNEPASGADDDVALAPGANADNAGDVARFISADVRARYEVHSYRHAAAILATSYPDELVAIEEALMAFSLTTREIGMPGGNESEMPKKLARTLRPKGWVESRIQGDLLVRMQQFGEEVPMVGRPRKVKLPDAEPQVISNFIDGHKIDFVKGRVALDMEWNSKDQTFDRDLYAMRAFHECGLISAGVLVTRSASLNPVFDRVVQLDKSGEPELFASGAHKGNAKTVKAKYGASTTWMGKLLYRLNAGRHGGCPVLVFGITPAVISDWSNE